MIHRQPHWQRPFRSLTGLKTWLAEQFVDCMPNGQLLILAGTVLVAGVILTGLFSLFPSTGQIENETLSAMQAMQTPSDWADAAADSNPLMQSVLTGGFILTGMLALGALLVCLDRTRQHWLD